MVEEFDTVILALAELLGCDPAIVRIYYDKHKISETFRHPRKFKITY